MSAAPDREAQARDLLAFHLHPRSATRARLLRGEDWRRDATVAVSTAVAAIAAALDQGGGA